MTPEERKAKELVEKFMPNARFKTESPVGRKEYAKACALICIENILAECKFLGTADYRIPYWQQVRTSIESLK